MPLFPRRWPVVASSPLLAACLSSGPIVEAKHVDCAQDCPDRYVSRMVLSWWFGRKDGRSGGTAFRHHRRRIGFSSRYTTNGPQILRRSVAVGWLVGMAASIRLVDQGARFGPRRLQFCCFAVLRWVEATRLVLFFLVAWNIFIAHTHRFLPPYFHLTANNRRTPCLRQHCRCQRCRQGHPGHWCRCRRSGEP